MMRSATLAFLMLLVASVSSWAGAPVQPKPFDGNQPIRITSDRLKADDNARQMTFIGHVVARQGDVTIYADNLTVFYEKEKRDIDRVEAEGDVRVVQNNRVATGGKGIFYRKEGRIVLTDGPAVHQGDNFIKGKTITVFLNEEKSIVTGDGDSRVNAVFQPSKGTP
jgi:lipopolysaccharide export system protein LptA